MPCICYMFNPSKTCLPSSALPVVALWPRTALGPSIIGLLDPPPKHQARRSLTSLNLPWAPCSWPLWVKPLYKVFFCSCPVFIGHIFFLPLTFFIKALWFTKAFQLGFRCIILQHRSHHQGLLPSTNVPRFPSLYPHPSLLSSLLTGTFPMFTVSH